MSSLSHRVGTQAPTVYDHYDFFSKLINMEKYNFICNSHGFL